MGNLKQETKEMVEEDRLSKIKSAEMTEMAKTKYGVSNVIASHKETKQSIPVFDVFSFVLVSDCGFCDKMCESMDNIANLWWPWHNPSRKKEDIVEIDCFWLLTLEWFFELRFMA